VLAVPKLFEKFHPTDSDKDHGRPSEGEPQTRLDPDEFFRPNASENHGKDKSNGDSNGIPNESPLKPRIIVVPSI
jgi:hypothetical protein